MLEGQQAFEPTLGDFRLVWGIGGVPAGIFEHVALDDRRQMGIVIAHADERTGGPVLRGDGFQPVEGFAFGNGRFKRKRLAASDGGGHRPAHQVFKRFKIQHGEHVPDFAFVRADVPIDKFVAIEQRIE